MKILTNLLLVAVFSLLSGCALLQEEPLSGKEKIFSYEHENTNCGANGCNSTSQNIRFDHSTASIKGEGSGYSSTQGIGHHDNLTDDQEMKKLMIKLQEIEDGLLERIKSGEYKGEAQRKEGDKFYFYTWEGQQNDNGVYDFKVDFEVFGPSKNDSK